MKYKKGFTLIELLVVISIIGILSAIVLALMSAPKAKGKDAAVQTDLRSAQTQAEVYYYAHNSSYANVCTSGTGSIQPMYDQIAKVVGSGSTNVYCNSTAVAYKIEAKAQSKTGTYCMSSSFSDVAFLSGAIAASGVTCP